MLGNKGLQDSSIKRLSFEKIAYIVNKEMAEIGKSAITLPGPLELEPILPKLNLYKEGDEAFFYIVTYVHALPLYLRMRNGKIKCYLGDSQGWHWKYYPSRIMIDSLNKFFGHRIEIILPNTQLQPQTYQKGCVVHALTCLKYCAKHGKQFFNDLEKTPHTSVMDKKKLEMEIAKYGFTVPPNIILLAENELPQHFCQFIEKDLASSRDKDTPFWLENVKTVNIDVTNNKYAEYEKLAQVIPPTTGDTLVTLHEWQQLSPDYFIPDVETPPIFNIDIKNEADEYVLTVAFKNEVNFLYGNCVIYANVPYLAQVSHNLQNIFADLGGEVQLDDKSLIITFKTNTLEALQKALSSLTTTEKAAQLYQQGMRQTFGLSHFVFEAQEALEMKLLKTDEKYAGGLFLGDVNAALAYFILSSGQEKVAVLPEQFGIENQEIPQEVKKLLENGMEKVVFSCGVVSEMKNKEIILHQIAIIVDRKAHEIKIINSEDINFEQKVKSLFVQDHYFNNYNCEQKIPLVMQKDDDKWSCGVQVTLNILDDLNELDDRKNVNMDEWLRKIIRAANAQRRVKQEKEQRLINLNNIIGILRDSLNHPLVEDKNERTITSLIHFLTNVNFAQNPPLMLYDFYNKPGYLDEYKRIKQKEKSLEESKNIRLNDGETALLEYIYVLMELNMPIEDLKAVIAKFLSILNSPIAEADFVSNKSEGIKSEEFSLKHEITMVLRYEVEGILDTKMSISSKKSWLHKMFLLSLGEGRCSLPMNVIDKDSLSNSKARIIEQSKIQRSEKEVDDWIGYLFFNMIINLTADLVEAEQAEKRSYLSQGKNNEQAQQRIKADIQSHLELIQQHLGESENQHASVFLQLNQLGKKLFICSPQDWAEILKAIHFDGQLLDEIMYQYQNNQFSNFYFSLFKTLHEMGKDAEVINLAANENLLLSAAQHLSAEIQSLRIDPCLALFKQLPLDLVLKVLGDIENKIPNIDHLRKILMEVPEPIRIEWAIRLTRQIDNLKKLDLITQTLPSNHHYQFLNEFFANVPTIQHDKYLSKFTSLLKALPLQERKTLLFNCERFIVDAKTLIHAMKVLPKNERLSYLNNFLKLVDGSCLHELISRLPEPAQYPFLLSNDKLIQNGQEIANNITFVPSEKQLDFIHRQTSKITDISDVLAILKFIPVDKKIEFVINYATLIQNEKDYLNIISSLPIENRADFIKYLNRVPQDFDSFLNIFSLLPTNKQLNFAIKYQDNVSDTENLELLMDLLAPNDKIIFQTHYSSSNKAGNKTQAYEKFGLFKSEAEEATLTPPPSFNKNDKNTI